MTRDEEDTVELRTCTVCHVEYDPTLCARCGEREGRDHDFYASDDHALVVGCPDHPPLEPARVTVTTRDLGGGFASVSMEATGDVDLRDVMRRMGYGS